MHEHTRQTWGIIVCLSLAGCQHSGYVLNVSIHSMEIHCVMQKKDGDIEELLKKNATLEEAVRQKTEAGKSQVNQVGIYIAMFLPSLRCTCLLRIIDFKL